MRTIFLAAVAAAGLAWAEPAETLDPSSPEVVEAERTLQRMADAVLAADTRAYLSLVDPSDRVLYTEERHFIEDVVVNTPAQYALLLNEPRLEDGELRATMTASWRMGDKDPREVTYPVRLVRGESGWLYAGRIWERLEADHCVVFFLPGFEEVAAGVVEAMPGIMEHVEEGLEIEPPEGHMQQVKLYDDMKELQFSIFPSYEDGLGGWNEPGESIKLLVRRGMSGEHLTVVLAHEYGHVGTFFMGEKATDAPWWVLEGIAELAAEEFADSWDRTHRRVMRWAKEGKLAPWEAMAPFPLLEPKWGGHVYTQGHHMLGFISERYGRTPRNQWLRRLAEGMPLDDATQSALRVSFADLDGQWRDFVASELAAEAAQDVPGGEENSN